MICAGNAKLNFRAKKSRGEQISSSIFGPTERRIGKVIQAPPSFDLSLLTEIILDRNERLVIGLDLCSATGSTHKPERVLISGDPVKRRLEELLG